nr:hypothetical protein [uncultured Agathobaculum sp.]
MLTSSFSGDVINVALRQMGATSIKEIRNGILYIAKFELSSDLCITYVFDVTKRNKYFLQRVTPYPISHGDFDGAQEVVEFIRKDVKKFRNAMHSHNFPKFLDAANQMVVLTHAAELLFLERNVSAEDLDSLRACLEASIDKIREIHSRAPKVE